MLIVWHLTCLRTLTPQETLLQHLRQLLSACGGTTLVGRRLHTFWYDHGAGGSWFPASVTDVDLDRAWLKVGDADIRFAAMVADCLFMSSAGFPKL